MVLTLKQPLGLGLGGQGKKATAGTPPTNYFVDSVGGSNANNGLSAGAAKQTIAAVPLANNIIISLKRGSKWREQLDISTYTGMVVNDYGTGVLPILDASDQLPNSGWTQPNSGTMPNVWQLVVTTGAAIATQFASIWENDVRLKFVNGASVVNANAGSFTILGSSNGVYGATTTTFQIYSTTSPNTNGKKYEYAARNYGCATGTGASVTNIHTRRNAHNNGSFIAGTNSQITGCIFEDGSKHNAYCSPGTTMTDCIAWKCDYQAPERDGWIGIVAHASTLHGTEIATFVRCQVVVEKAVFELAGSNGITGFYCHTDGSPGSVWGRIFYTDCAATYCQSAFSSNDCLGVTHTRTRVQNCTGGISLPNGDNNTTPAAVNYVTDCWLEEGSEGYVLGRGILPGGASTTIDGLRMCITHGGNDGMIYGGMRAGTTIKYSAFARLAPSADGYMQYIRAESSTGGVFQNNVIWGPNTGYGEQMLFLATATLDHNAYGGLAGDFVANSISAETGPYLTAAQAAGSEAGSVTYSGIPFNNLAAGDFSLKAASPSLNPATYGVQRFPTYQTVLTSAAIAAM